jgi:hypothetical protein
MNRKLQKIARLKSEYENALGAMLVAKEHYKIAKANMKHCLAEQEAAYKEYCDFLFSRDPQSEVRNDR